MTGGKIEAVGSKVVGWPRSIASGAKFAAADPRPLRPRQTRAVPDSAPCGKTAVAAHVPFYRKRHPFHVSQRKGRGQECSCRKHAPRLTAGERSGERASTAAVENVVSSTFEDALHMRAKCRFAFEPVLDSPDHTWRATRGIKTSRQPTLGQVRDARTGQKQRTESLYAGRGIIGVYD